MKNIFVTTFASELTSVLQELYGEHEWDMNPFLSAIETPPTPELGDYAFPCFPLAKQLRQAPPRIAQSLQAPLQPRLIATGQFTDCAAAGPYLNVRVNYAFMATQTLPTVLDGTYFQRNAAESRSRVMIEFSQPNTHKGFHVGHCRNVALGDSLVQLYRYNGHEVIAANYIGDVGTHIAKCLWFYLDHNQAEPPETFRGEWLGELYTAATLHLANLEGEEEASAHARISQILAQLEAKEPDMLRIWDETRQWSLADFNAIYDWLGTRFDHVFFESEVDEAGKQFVLQGAEDGTFQRSEGAIGIDLQEQNLGFFLLLKSDGNTLYATKDLALAQRKFEEFSIERSIYVVGAEQTLHFQQVFATLQHMGYEQAAHCFHLPYALVVLPDGKMSSRAGNVILFSELQQKVSDFIRSTYLESHQGDWTEAEISDTTRKVAVAAIKYGMLNQDPNKQITFSLQDWLVAEGDTGVYLVYAYVRIRSIARSFDVDLSDVSPDYALLRHPTETALIRRVFDFNATVAQAGEQYRPSLLARFLYELARDFSRCYGACSVKYADSTALQHARLSLFHCVGETLRRGLQLLGIEPPERM